MVFLIFSQRALRLCEREYDIEFLIRSTEHNENDSRNGATTQRIIAKNVAAWREKRLNRVNEFIKMAMYFALSQRR